MLEVQVRDDNVKIVFSRNLMKDDDLMELIERIRVKHLISKSKLTEGQAEQLDTELKSDWWKKNRTRILDRFE